MSNGPEFFQTRMGQQFLEGTMPRIAKALEGIVLKLGDHSESKTAAVQAIAEAACMEVTTIKAGSVKLTYRKGSGADTFTEVTQDSLQCYLDEGWEVVRTGTPEEVPGFVEWAKDYAAQYGSLDAIEAYKAGAASVGMGPKHPNTMHPDNDAHDGTDKLVAAVYGRGAMPKDYLGGSEAHMLHDGAKLINEQTEELRELRKQLLENQGELRLRRHDEKLAAGELAVEIPEPGSDAARLLSANRLLSQRVEQYGKLISFLEGKHEGKLPLPVSAIEMEVLTNILEAEQLRISEEGASDQDVVNIAARLRILQRGGQ